MIKRFDKGFSLIELSIVLVIMGVVLMSVQSFIPSIKQALFSKDEVVVLESA